MYALDASIDFDEDNLNTTIFNLDFKNDFNQASIFIDRFGLDSKQLDILKLCNSWIPKKIISCKGKVLITGEILERKLSMSSSKPLFKFNYYLEAFKLEKQNIKKIIISLRKQEKDTLKSLFNKYQEVKLKISN